MVQQNDRTGREVFIRRRFDAPRELVFRAWAQADSLVQWFTPRSCSIEFRSFEFCQDGGFLSCVHAPGGHECWCKGVYLQIIEPELIQFTMSVSNAQGEAVDPVTVGMDPGWPRETVVTVTFEAAEGQTLLTLRQTVDEDLAKRTGAYPSWLEMFDRLAELGATMSC